MPLGGRELATLELADRVASDAQVDDAVPVDNAEHRDHVTNRGARLPFGLVAVDQLADVLHTNVVGFH